MSNTLSEAEFRRTYGSASRSLAGTWVQLALFAMPLLICICLPVYLVDPYGLFGKGGDAVKMENAARVNHVLLGIISFSKKPTPNILLGDSQMNHFKVDEIEAITHQPYSNLSYGGGTLAESMATFWYAAGIVKLEKVYFGMSFYSFTDNLRNRVDAAVHIVNSPSAYFVSGDVLESTWDDISSQIFHREVSYRPAVGIDEFWQQQLAELARRKQTYAASQETLAKLRAIVEYCRAHHIEIVFVIPPEHQDVRARILQSGMSDEYAAFKSAVFSLGATYDCDIPSELTRDRAHFQDPFHTTSQVGNLLTRSIWSGRLDWCDAKPAH